MSNKKVIEQLLHSPFYSNELILSYYDTSSQDYFPHLFGSILYQYSLLIFIDRITKCASEPSTKGIKAGPE